MNTTTVTTPNELEISVERIFDAPRSHVFSVWTDPELIPEWWGDGTVVEEMDVRPGGTYRFRTAYGAIEGEFREVEPPARLVQTFQNHLQTLEFEDVDGGTRLTQTMRRARPPVFEPQPLRSPCDRCCVLRRQRSFSRAARSRRPFRESRASALRALVRARAA